MEINYEKKMKDSKRAYKYFISRKNIEYNKKFAKLEIS